ncbi:MAG: hypothetical protein R3E79_07240 [Caldilineaceae bacterium]
MALHSTPEWRGQLRQFLNRREWTYVRWADELNQRRVAGNRYLHLTEFTLTRWLNSAPGKGEYRGPKLRDEYIDLAHALLQLQVITQAEARQWLLSQGLYPLPHEAVLFGPMTDSAASPVTVADFRQVAQPKE